MPLSLSTPDVKPAAKTIADAIDRNTAALTAVTETLKALGQIMHEALQALADRIDKATTAVAAEIRDLKAQLADGITADEAKPIMEQLDGIAGRLETMPNDQPLVPPTP